jgi:hypothetical protein
MALISIATKITHLLPVLPSDVLRKIWVYAQPGPQITASVVTTPKITSTLVTATSYGSQSLPRITRGNIKIVRERLASPILSILHTHEDTFHHHYSISSWMCLGGRIEY